MLIKDRDIQFTVNKDGERKVTGFTLAGMGETDAEAYCLSFPTAQRLEKADIIFEGPDIIFKHGGVSCDEAEEKFGVLGYSIGGDLRKEISPEDGKQLSELLDLKGDYADCDINVSYELAWVKGFTLYVKRKPGRIVFVNPSRDTVDNCPDMSSSCHYSTNQGKRPLKPKGYYPGEK